MEVEIIKAKGAGEDTSTGRKIDRLRVAARGDGSTAFPQKASRTYQRKS